MTIRVVAGAVVAGGRVLATRRRPEIARGGLWELPGGKVEAGESDEVALARELAEELGIGVDVGRHLATAVHDYGDVAIELVAYAATWRDGALVLTDHDTARWLAADDLDEVGWAPADEPFLGPLRELLVG